MTARQKDGIALALVNHKGGVGKTTSAVSLAAGIAAEGRELVAKFADFGKGGKTA